jgi:hypothetical protein
MCPILFQSNTETVIVGNQKVGLEVNAVNIKYILLFHYQIAGQNHDMKFANRSFENVA